MTQDLGKLSTLELMQSYAAILEELRRREIIRTNNAPLGDYAEYLVATTLGLNLQNNSKSGYDAKDANGIRYQIKSRLPSKLNPSMQLGAIRKLDLHDFDFLIAVIFQSDFSVQRVIKIPHEVVGVYAKYQTHTNSHLLFVQGEILKDKRVEDITSLFRK